LKKSLDKDIYLKNCSRAVGPHFRAKKQDKSATVSKPSKRFKKC